MQFTTSDLVHRSIIQLSRFVFTEACVYNSFLLISSFSDLLIFYVAISHSYATTTVFFQ